MTRMRFFLAISVILNIFLIGAVSGGVAWLNFGHRMINAGSLRVAGAELSADQRRAFRATLRHARAEISGTIATAREAKTRAAALLRQPQIDESALLEALAQARAADITVRATIEKKAVQFISGLPADDRARLADAVDDRVRRAMSRTP